MNDLKKIQAIQVREKPICMYIHQIRNTKSGKLKIYLSTTVAMKQVYFEVGSFALTYSDLTWGDLGLKFSGKLRKDSPNKSIKNDGAARLRFYASAKKNMWRGVQTVLARANYSTFTFSFNPRTTGGLSHLHTAGGGGGYPPPQITRKLRKMIW